MDWALDALGWDEVIHTIAPDNPASQHVARKLGAENRGPGRLPPPYADVAVDVWAQTREQWFARRRSNR
jgi:RimJ/RimL family protein N-acetyltransferase